MPSWLKRTRELQRELADIGARGPAWSLLAGGVAFAETRAGPDVYLACDTSPDADTFMGYPADAPADPIADAIARARAARTALAELDGSLPAQPLAVTIADGVPRPCSLAVAAFAVGDRCVVGALDDPDLPARIAAAIAGRGVREADAGEPFVCVSLGEEPVETVRHAHRRAWTKTSGPWLGLGRAAGLATVSTCHLVVDGYGHALITRRIAQLVPATHGFADHALPPLAPVPHGVPLAISWRSLEGPLPRVTELAYRLGQLLHREVGVPGARFSPTLQIPVARGAKDDPLRLRRRVVAATTSVRFDGDEPEPFEVFDARLRGVFAREAADRGLASRMLAAARAVPIPVAWKRRSIAAQRVRWLEDLAAVIGGRALLSRMSIQHRDDEPALPPIVAVSSPSRLASDADPVGGCVISIVDDGRRGVIAMCGSGFAGTPARASDLLDRLLVPGNSIPDPVRAPSRTRSS